MDKKNVVKGKSADAYLYEPDKKDRKVTDKDLFIMTQKMKKNKNKK